MAASVSRRDFARLFAVGGSAALFADPVWAKQNPQAPAFAPTIGGTGEAFWKSVRAQFVMPADLGVLNAANLCPASRPVLEALKRESDSVDKDPSAQNRARLSGEKENLRKTLAAFLRVTPEEIVITRNTSEANNMVSSGVDLKAGDEVIVFHDNHPSNLDGVEREGEALRLHGDRDPADEPAPGDGALRRRLHEGDHAEDQDPDASRTCRARLAICSLPRSCARWRASAASCRSSTARSRSACSTSTSPRSSPDFYTGSAHKWPCGARECGVLYINARAHKNIWPSIYSAYPGAVGISRTFESFGQRDEATMIAFREALEFQTKVGREAIEKRSRALAQPADRRTRRSCRT